MENNKKKKFKLFDMNKDGKGAVKEDRKPTFKFFFKLFFRKFGNILRLNLLMLFQVIPLLIVCGVYFLGDKSPAATNVLFAPLSGINQAMGTPYMSPLLDLSSIQMGMPVFSPVVNFTILGLGIFLAITWGWQNVGATYVLRGLVRGDAVFVFSDYFYGIKKNFKQGFFLGLIDFIISALLIFDLWWLSQQELSSFSSYFILFATGAIAVIYFIMRFYMYLLLVTFDIKIFKLIKNSLIFTVLGIWRNTVAFLGIAFLVILHGLSFLLVFTGVSVTIILPFLYAIAATAFIAAYAAYPVIDKYMIAPYADKEEKEDEEFIYFKNEEDEGTS